MGDEEIRDQRSRFRCDAATSVAAAILSEDIDISLFVERRACGAMRINLREPGNKILIYVNPVLRSCPRRLCRAGHRSAAHRPEQCRQFRRRNRPAEQVALRLVATIRLQEIALLRCFHALGDQCQFEAPGELDELEANPGLELPPLLLLPDHLAQPFGLPDFDVALLHRDQAVALQAREEATDRFQRQAEVIADLLASHAQDETAG